MNMLGDVNELVQEVAKRRSIWDPQHTDYNNEDKNEEHWLSIGEILYRPYWSVMNDVKKNSIVFCMEQRWKKLKHYFFVNRLEEFNTQKKNKDLVFFQTKLAFLDEIDGKHYLRNTKKRLSIEWSDPDLILLACDMEQALFVHSNTENLASTSHSDTDCKKNEISKVNEPSFSEEKYVYKIYLTNNELIHLLSFFTEIQNLPKTPELEKNFMPFKCIFEGLLTDFVLSSCEEANENEQKRMKVLTLPNRIFFESGNNVGSSILTVNFLTFHGDLQIDPSGSSINNHSTSTFDQDPDQDQMNVDNNEILQKELSRTMC